MLHFRSLNDLQTLEVDPELWREVYGYMSVCVNEFLQGANPDDLDDLDDHDFQFQVASENDVAYLIELGTPEEWALIEIISNEGTRCFCRIIYTTEVIFIPESLVASLPFLNHNS